VNNGSQSSAVKAQQRATTGIGVSSTSLFTLLTLLLRNPVLIQFVDGIHVRVSYFHYYSIQILTDCGDFHHLNRFLFFVLFSQVTVNNLMIPLGASLSNPRAYIGFDEHNRVLTASLQQCIYLLQSLEEI